MQTITKRIFLINLIILLASGLYAQDWHWVKQMGDEQNDVGWWNAVDESGNNYVAGYFQDNITFGNTVLTAVASYDTYLAKYDSDGNALWAIKAGGDGEEQIEAVEIDDAGNVYIVGHFDGESISFQSQDGNGNSLTTRGQVDAFTAKYDAGGNLQWVKQIGIEGTGTDFSSTYLNGVAIANDGSVNVAGRFWKKTDVDGIILEAEHYGDGFFVRYQSNGDVSWAKQTHTSYDGRAYGIDVDHEGNVFVNGDFKGSITFANDSFNCHDDVGNEDVFLAKYNPDGENLWAKHIGGFGEDVTWDLGVDAFGNCYTSAHFMFEINVQGEFFESQGSYDMIFAKYGPDGTPHWVKHDGGAGIDVPYHIETTPNGMSYLSGKFENTVTFGDTTISAFNQTDGFISIYDRDGNFVKVAQVQGKGIETVHALGIDEQGDEYICGYFQKNIIVDNETYWSNGLGDVFSIKLDIDLPDLPEPGTLAGVVEDNETGEPIAGAEISAAGFSTSTDETGSYSMVLPVGEHTATCSVEGYNTAESDITISENETLTLDFALEPIVPGVLTGNVTDDETGQAISGAEIVVGEYSTTTDSDGDYTMELPAGEYTVTCSADGYNSDEQNVTISQGQTHTVDFSLEPFGSSGTLAGGVKDSESGAPIAGAVITAGDYSTHSDEDGKFTLELPEGEYTVICTADGYNEEQSDVTITSGDTHSLYFTLVPEASSGILEGVVKDAESSEPIEGALIEAGSHSTTTDSDGEFSMELPVGEYTVTCSAEGYTDEESTITISDDETESLYFALEPLNVSGALTGLVEAADSGEPISGAEITAGEYTTTTDNEGNYSMELPEGDYTVSCAAQGFVTEEANASVNGNETVTIDFEMEELNLPAPRNLTADVFGVKNVRLEWDEPAEPEPMELAWDDGSAESMSFPMGCQIVAVGFNPQQQVELDSIKVCLTASTNFPQDITFNVVGDDNGQPDEENVLAGPYTISYTPEGILGEPEWVTIDIDNISLAAGQKFYIQSMYNSSNNYDVGMDKSDPDPYSFATMDGGESWVQAPGLDIMFRAIVLAYPENRLNKDVTSQPLGYNIYRNGDVVNEQPVGELSYEDLSLYSGPYDYSVSAIYEAGESYASDAVHVDIDKYFDFTGGDASEDVWTIYLPSLQLEGEDLGRGDEVAIFDGATMVGAFELSEVVSPENQFENYMTAFSVVEDGEGYTPGNNITLKCYDASQELQADYADTTYYNPYGDAWTLPEFPDGDGEYSITEMNFLTIAMQNIPLNSGYQLVSSNVESDSSNMTVILEDLTENQTLGFVRNDNGDMFRQAGPMWINNIGNWNTPEGYLFYMEEEDLLVKEGSEVNPETPIALQQGYQFVSYLLPNPANALEAVDTILENIDYMRNSEGQTLRKIDGEWINNIGNMNPGEGYIVHMNTADTLIYNTGAEPVSRAKNAASHHFDFAGGNPADAVYTVYLNPDKNVSVGDEVAAYDNGKLVGATTVRSQNFADNSLPVFAELNTGSGYFPGDAIEFKMWDSSEGTVQNVEFEMSDKYPGAYAQEIYPDSDGEFSVAKISAKTTGISGENALSIHVYPNPARDNFILVCNQVPAKAVVTSMSGRVVVYEQLTSSKQVVDISSLSAGIYTLKVKTADEVKTRKLIVR